MPGRADPAIYPKLRAQALAIRLPGLAPDALHAVVMDWPAANGMTTVLAAADGTASIYLSSGGGFIGGSQGNPAIKAAALHAMRLAEYDHGGARSTVDTPLPTSSAVFFYFVYASGLLLNRVNEKTLRDGTSDMRPLGIAMQKIITEYRVSMKSPKAGKTQ
jgi:hypothetical protein